MNACIEFKLLTNRSLTIFFLPSMCRQLVLSAACLLLLLVTTNNTTSFDTAGSNPTPGTTRDSPTTLPLTAAITTSAATTKSTTTTTTTHFNNVLNHPSTFSLPPLTTLSTSLQQFSSEVFSLTPSLSLSLSSSSSSLSSPSTLTTILTTTTTTTVLAAEFYSNSRSTYKCPNQCDCFNIDETIDCSHRGLNFLPSFSLNTKRLYLEDNRVAYLPLDSFSSAPDLLLIVLERNEVTHVDGKSFCGLMKLQELDLGGNRIQTFVVLPNSENTNSNGNKNDKKNNKSCVLPSLKEINLSLNLLANVPKFLSAFAPNLEILNLSYNEIEIVAVDDSYSYLKFLKHLDLSRNKIHWISENDLKPLSFTSLEILNLAECGMSGVEPNSFDGLNNLSSLSLANNLLNPIDVFSILRSFSKRKNTNTTYNDLVKQNESQKNVMNNTYADTHSNYSLFNFNDRFSSKSSLSNSDAQTFENDTGSTRNSKTENNNNDYIGNNKENVIGEKDEEEDDGHNSLTRLDLSEIPLPNITRLMLGSFKHLVILDLSICDVEWIEPELFTHLANLETLHLEFGKLLELNNLAYHKKLRRLYLQDNRLKFINVTGVYTLETLDLSYNKIESIPKDWLVGLRNLQILNLSHNNILSVNWNALKQSSIMLTLDISFNKITSLNNFGLNRLTKLDASHNSISALDHDTFEHLHQTITGIDLSYNNISTFDALIFKQAHNLQTLNLAYNKLFKWNNIDINNNFNDANNYSNNDDNYLNTISPFANLQLLKNLDLSGNELTKLTCQTFLPLRNLMKVNLRDNKFTDVKNTGVNCARSLVKLILSNNKMTTADVTILDSMLSLEELDISSNPFNCDCNIVPFLRWANETRVRIIKEVETDNYKCHYDSITQEQQQQLYSNLNNYAYSNEDDDRNFLFSYRPELDNCFDVNGKKQPKYDSFIPDFDNILPSSLQYQNIDADKDQNNYINKSGSIKYFSVFCLTTLAGIFIGMTVIFVAWRFRTSVYTIKCFSPRWRRVRYREVADDLESALDSRV